MQKTSLYLYGTLVNEVNIDIALHRMDKMNGSLLLTSLKMPESPVISRPALTLREFMSAVVQGKNIRLNQEASQ